MSKRSEDLWQIKCIVGGPKTESSGGKRETFYKVRWCDSYERASNLPSEEIKSYLEKQRGGPVKVLGPYIEGSSKSKPKKSIYDMDFAVQISDKIAVMNYKEVKESYCDELLFYFEQNAVVDE
ncbi:hypothetical protein AAVH_23051 [Aphelenchoides avenae]|nr:hypothetical protein AAVH_31537 [Aphelenchus avenae]KAH7709667.1 hypothetical protein AAVH_23051 [Aphelenchus avenae]